MIRGKGETVDRDGGAFIGATANAGGEAWKAHDAMSALLWCQSDCF